MIPRPGSGSFVFPSGHRTPRTGFAEPIAVGRGELSPVQEVQELVTGMVSATGNHA